jgi:hypothetical protein
MCHQCDYSEPQSLKVDTKTMQQNFAGLIQNIEVRVDGVCQNCLQTDQNFL